MLIERGGWRCVTFDRRGHARSGDPCHGYDFDTLSDDVASILGADFLDPRNDQRSPRMCIVARTLLEQ
jgi:pimeloyl-ACP methyl ester carboxylesterase